MKKLLIILAISINLFSADATISVINQGIALPKIVLQDNTQIQNNILRDKFYKIMLGDLRVSSDFEILDSRDNISIQNADLTLQYELSNNDTLELSVKLINAKTGIIRFEKKYTVNDETKYPFLAHKSIVELVNELGLPSVEWMDNFIIFSKYTEPSKSEIVVADYTLSYQKTIIKGGLNIFPKWANKDQSKFYYTAYPNNKPTLFLYDLNTGKKNKIIESNGMLVASDISSDGSKILLTMAPKDQADIFIYNTKNKALKQLTKYPGVDVNANFVDDDSKVVFVSDRLGYPNIFSINSNGGVVEQMVFSGRNNSSVSTFGNYVVYSSREGSGEFKNSFNIYLISTKTDYVRQLTANGKNTYPRFSNDGGSIIFIKQLGAQSSLGVIRLNENKSFQFPLKVGKIQSIDW